MILIVGLGNPGKKYEKTRHNLGFMVVDELGERVKGQGESWKLEEKFKSEILNFTLNASPLTLVKPQTYMNNSGLAVQLLITNYQLPITDLWIIHDDVDLPLGSMKIRFGGASAGHKGVQSIINSLKIDKFWRFRMGIGEQYQKSPVRHTQGKYQKFRDVEDFVLGEFGEGEFGKLRKLIKCGSKAIQTGLEEGLEKAMNRFNTK